MRTFWSKMNLHFGLQARPADRVVVADDAHGVELEFAERIRILLGTRRLVVLTIVFDLLVHSEYSSIWYCSVSPRLLPALSILAG